MGNTDTKLNFRKAVVQLTSKTQVSFILIFHMSTVNNNYTVFTVISYH